MCTALIKRHILGLKATKIFTTRELIQYGRRGAVDQALHRMVKGNFIKRLARGEFVRDARKKPTIKKIAIVKAAAFGRKLLYHAKNKLVDLKLAAPAERDKNLFAINGHSSSFLTIHGRVSLHGIGRRKVQLSKTAGGKVVYALWSLGEGLCSPNKVATALFNMRRTHREDLRRASALMPAWLHHLCRHRYAMAPFR